MNKLSHHEVDVELLGKYLAGEASPGEAMAVDEWMSSSEENRRLYEQLAAVWARAGQEQAHLLPDREQQLQALKQQANAISGRTKVIRSNRYWQSVAAAVLVVAGAAAFFFLSRPAKKQAVSTFVSREAGTGTLRDTLQDGSLFVLNSHAGIKIPDSFNKRERSLQLRGEGWFDVTSHSEKPFMVHTGGISIRVLGTSFNVREYEGNVEVAVKSGAVMMYKDDQQITVKAGGQGLYTAATGRFSLTGVFQPNNVGYATRIFSFEQATLQEVATQLEKAYGITVVFEKEALKSCTMSSSFDNKPVRYIFDVISITLNVDCRFENNTVYISGEGCS